MTESSDRAERNELRRVQANAIRDKVKSGMPLDRDEFVVLYGDMSFASAQKISTEVRKHGDPHKAARWGFSVAMVEVFGQLCVMAMKQQQLEQRLAELESKRNKPRIRVVSRQ